MWFTYQNVNWPNGCCSRFVTVTTGRGLDNRADTSLTDYTYAVLSDSSRQLTNSSTQYRRYGSRHSSPW